MKPEFWRPVVGYEEYYSVSSWGRVCRIRGGQGTRAGKILRQNDNGNGYMYVCLTREGNQKRFAVHRLVLEGFKIPCPEGMEACHNDGNRANNALRNLRWDTRAGNHLDKDRHGTSLRGEKHNLAHLSETDVRDIRRMYETGLLSQREIAEEHGITQSQVSRIVLRKNWKHVD